MKRLVLSFLCLISLTTLLKAQDTAPLTNEATFFVKVETNKGNFVVALYDGTPRHRDNFLQLVRAHSYEGTLFHRVIDRFMIQGGNLMTRGATASTDVSQDTISTRIPHEIDLTRFFHKHGALCAAREGDEVNPEKASSSTQFYIVTGNYFTDLDLDELEARTGRKYTPEQREAYKLYGGTPHLDNGYTVFGEVVSGMNVVEEIQCVATDDQNRPRKDVIIKKVSIVANPKK